MGHLLHLTEFLVLNLKVQSKFSIKAFKSLKISPGIMISGCRNKLIPLMQFGRIQQLDAFIMTSILIVIFRQSMDKQFRKGSCRQNWIVQQAIAINMTQFLTQLLSLAYLFGQGVKNQNKALMWFLCTAYTTLVLKQILATM
ncbi:hypothetical protein FGO68_gene1857 [Halteria grandinella]|uniref:Uncharacterized protein n=1 Tax=Halteria grandinella TaxID=5974 RepID=A0A8J8SUR7_HALGN|nr:hypothetical protein FGO68_gene1857 [Halteria grandinella]